jgi:hypothetical protein
LRLFHPLCAHTSQKSWCAFTAQCFHTAWVTSGLRPSSQHINPMMARISVPQRVSEPLARAGRHQIQAGTKVRIVFGARSLGLVEQNALGAEIRNAIGRCCNHLPPLTADIAAPSEDPALVIAGLQKDLSRGGRTLRTSSDGAGGFLPGGPFECLDTGDHHLRGPRIQRRLQRRRSGRTRPILARCTIWRLCSMPPIRMCCGISS